MYHPYFRGRQNELIVIRDRAELLAKAGFVPIVEPVKEAINGLVRATNKVASFGGSTIVIVTPTCGDFAGKQAELARVLLTEFMDVPGLSFGVRIEPTSDLVDVAATCRDYDKVPLTIVHCGYPDGRSVAAALSGCARIAKHVFMDESCGKLYRKHFKTSERVLIRDGFKRRTNREYPLVEPFSELHVTFPDEGMTGFGDFLIVGDDYQEAGGPAYAVAIHLTYIDSQQDDEMFVLHFVSDTTDTPQDPAGKFAEALGKLVSEVERGDRPILRTSAVEEFLELHRNQHFPGLGIVKKLSMLHHIETLERHLRSQGSEGR
jgi:hypothetical protein